MTAEHAALAVYALVALLVAWRAYRTFRAEHADVLEALLLGFAAGVFWPLLALLGVLVTFLLLLSDRRNGAP